MKKLQQLTERTFRFFETRIAGTVYCYLLSLQEQVTKRGQLYCVVILSVAKNLSKRKGDPSPLAQDDIFLCLFGI